MKQVTFNADLNKVHILLAWSFAYRKARESDYAQCILDRYRFQNRIKYTKNLLRGVLEDGYRNKIYSERFK